MAMPRYILKNIASPWRSCTNASVHWSHGSRLRSYRVLGNICSDTPSCLPAMPAEASLPNCITALDLGAASHHFDRVVGQVSPQDTHRRTGFHRALPALKSHGSVTGNTHRCLRDEGVGLAARAVVVGTRLRSQASHLRSLGTLGCKPLPLARLGASGLQGQLRYSPRRS
jgi:hypothetical protein